ncbi:MAG: phosphatase PAP2 family protein [Acidobacteriota bacterium]|jgi:membrane-associated phospholipid phosphatase
MSSACLPRVLAAALCLCCAPLLIAAAPPGTAKKSTHSAAKRESPKSTLNKSPESDKAHSQASGARVEKLDRAYWRSFVTDPEQMFKSPAKWKKSTWIKLGVTTGTALILYHYDEHIRTWAQEHRNKTSNNITKIVKPFGNGYFTMPLLAGFYLAGRFDRNTKLQETSRLAFESFLLTGAVTQVLKFGVHRDRPSESPYNNVFNGPSFNNKHLSFPSGHASSAFALATMFATEYRGRRWVPPLAYTLASLTALSRINSNAHWASDVFVGSALGYFMSKEIYRLHQKPGRHDLTMIPVVGPHAGAVYVAWDF